MINKGILGVPWICSDCGKEFDTLVELNAHMELNHLFVRADTPATKMIPIRNLAKDQFRDQLILALVGNLATPDVVSSAFSSGKVGDIATKIVGLADLIMEKRRVTK